MSNFQYKTIPATDIDKYPGWEVVSETKEEDVLLICERSGQPIARCENVECARLKTHITRPRITKKDMVTIRKTENILVP